MAKKLQPRQWSNIGFRKRHYATTLEMFEKPLGPSQIAAIAAAKGMRATACGQVIGEGVEHALIELFYSNLLNRGPFSQVCDAAILDALIYLFREAKHSAAILRMKFNIVFF